MQPIFIIGVRRSGTNLLRVMLDQLPQIACPHPPHILHRLRPMLNRYGDLSCDQAFRHLIDDACRLVETNPIDWDGVRLDRDEVFRRCRERSLVAVYGAIYDLYATHHGADTWCCKSTDNIAHIDELERHFDKPKYIFLYRDGRDVALSFRKAVVGEKHIFHIAREWAQLQALGTGIAETIGPARCMPLAYEALTGDPEATARELCEFLGVPFTERMLQFHHSGEAKRTANSSVLWANVAKPLMRDNSRKFMREASEHDLRIFESVAGHMLDRWGYPRAYVNPGDELQFSAEQLNTFRAENEKLKQQVFAALDDVDRERRDQQAQLLAEIAARPALHEEPA